jgi:type IV pilus assembly protein PilO
MLMDIDLQQLNELDFNEMGEWPIPVKLVAVLLVGILVLGGVYYVDTMDQMARLAVVEAKEQELRLDFQTKQQKAANLDAYRQQLAEMQESFGAMLRQLPDKTEVASLLVEVSQTGLGAGLEFELFQPAAEVPKDFYAELPIQIKVVGTFHEFGNFISGLAALPRIVTIHNVTIMSQQSGGRPPGSQGKQSRLLLDATAKTYRYLDEGS